MYKMKHGNYSWDNGKSKLKKTNTSRWVSTTVDNYFLKQESLTSTVVLK